MYFGTWLPVMTSIKNRNPRIKGRIRLGRVYYSAIERVASLASSTPG
jgi:hypothetical protein